MEEFFGSEWLYTWFVDILGRRSLGVADPGNGGAESLVIVKHR